MHRRNIYRHQAHLNHYYPINRSAYMKCYHQIVRHILISCIINLQQRNLYVYN